jgi:cellulose synthase/poly-beta-1,6-N-acetylglucosamine synthase-like glycosyltransferase
MTSSAEFLFWTSFTALAYVYVGYPLLLAIVSLFSDRRRANLGYKPRLSFLIAAYNEETGIKNKIAQTLALDYPTELLEILVVSDGSTDRTEAIVESFVDPRIHLLRIGNRKGKTNAQNEAVKKANGEILIFSDATTVYHPQALQFLAANYADPSVGAVSGRYLYFDPAGKSPTGLGSIAFWNYENLIKSLQSRIQTITGCCGCIYSVRRESYSPLAPDVISDLVQPLHVIRKGYRVLFEDRALAFEETTQSTSQEFSMRVRVVTRGIRGLLSVRNLLQPWKYPWVSLQLWSHKVLRWFVPFILVTLLASNLALWNRPGFRLFLLMQGLFYSVAGFSILVPIQRRWRVLGIPLYFCVLNAAAFVSVIEVLRGKKYTTWRTVRTQT